MADGLGFSWDQQQNPQIKAQKAAAAPAPMGAFGYDTVFNPGDPVMAQPPQPPGTVPGADPYAPKDPTMPVHTGDPYGNPKVRGPAPLIPPATTNPVTNQPPPPAAPLPDHTQPEHANPKRDEPGIPPMTTNPVPGQPEPGKAGPPGNDYATTMSQLQSATDPKQQAVLQDQLARDVFASLKTAGHDVEWNGDQLMVDGRPYVVGGGTSNPALEAGRADGTTNNVPYEQGGITGGNTGPVTGPATTNTAGPVPTVPPGMSPPDAAVFLLNQGLQGQALTDALRAQGYQDNGLYYPDRNMYGFANAYIGQDASGNYFVHQRDPEPGLPTSITPDLQSKAPGAAGVDLANSAYVPPANGQPNPAATTNAFPTSGPAYTPGQIGTEDIPNFSYDDLVKQLGNLGPTDKATEDLITSILQHPDSIDPKTVDMLKAKSKDELAQMSASDLQELKAQGQRLGITDSTWLQSEINSSKSSRDQALVKGNRDIELNAATTNAADRRAAATLGMSYTSARASQKLQATQLAADTTLRAAAVRGDRMALRESINQKAAELGQSADRIQLDYTMGLITDATHRYGIDVGASIDRAKLSQAGREFQEDLAFRIMALQQADSQFGAQYGLDVAKTQHQFDQDSWNRYKDIFGG